MTYTVVRDPHAPRRPYIIQDAAGREVAQSKRGGGTMARHFATREAAQRVADALNKGSEIP